MSSEKPKSLLNKPIANGWISHQELKELHELSSWRSLTRVVMEYLAIAICIFAGIKSSSILLYLLTLVIIGSRQHALFILMHDAAHGLIAKNKKVNDTVGRLISWSLFASFDQYRAHHKDHHVQKWLNTEKDPDFVRKQTDEWKFPMKKKRFYLMLFRDISGFGALDYLNDIKTLKKSGHKVKNKNIAKYRLSFYVLSIIILTLVSGWSEFFFYWVIPFITYLKLVFRFRSIADHSALENEHLYDRTRTIIPNFLEKLLIAPCSISIHNEHHTFQSVPYYKLRKLHSLLMRNKEYERNIILDPGYVWLIPNRLTK